MYYIQKQVYWKEYLFSTHKKKEKFNNILNYNNCKNNMEQIIAGRNCILKVESKVTH